MAACVLRFGSHLCRIDLPGALSTPAMDAQCTGRRALHRRRRFDALVQVLAVVQGAEVVLDGVAAQRVKKESPPPKAFQAEEPPTAAPTGPPLDRAQTRAALFFKLLSLVNGRSGVRLAVAEALVALLNSGVLPALPDADADADSLAALAAFLQGVGACVLEAGEKVDAPSALAKAGLESAPGLSAQERSVLTDGQSCAAGTAALCCGAGRQLLAAANAVAALSAEALQADVSLLLVVVSVHLVPLPAARPVALRRCPGCRGGLIPVGACCPLAFSIRLSILFSCPLSAGQRSGYGGGGGGAAQGGCAGGRGDARPA